MERYVCIHGHFYQPPRENPWLEAIEMQDSADPYHDWNERVTAECYEPNAASRILDEEGRIATIANNYARISFDFGPTLLAWLESKEPVTYDAILAADRESQQRFDGHGSAMAQAYNHIIMPLANSRDRLTQVKWGIRDFEYRFGRFPEGMWLPETAVDDETLEILADQGIRFTVLAPYQASKIRSQGRRDWQDVGNGRIDPTRPYLCRLPSGQSITIFFYDGPISQAVAFERLLSSGERFASRLVNGFNSHRTWPEIMHIATDGETYGHHHTHGDMALAYALDHIESRGLARLINYGSYLAKHPPADEVQIFQDTAWSCAHGIERWRSDCGCNAGMNSAWNQAWRGPLRDALNWLRDELSPAYEREASQIFRDPWSARDAYIDIILDRSPDNVDRVLNSEAGRPLSADERIKALKLLEMQRHTQLMYTSCGWFFDDLANIETVQVIQYAGRAVQLAEDVFGVSLEEQFLRRLDLAQSNVPASGSGRQIWDRAVVSARVDLPKVAAHFAISSVFTDYSSTNEIYSYEVELEDYKRSRAGRASLATGKVQIRSRIIGESAHLSFGALHFGDHNLVGGVRVCDDSDTYRQMHDNVNETFRRADFANVVRLLDQYFGPSMYSLRSLFRDEQRSLLNQVLRSTIADTESVYRHIYEDNAPLLRYLADLGSPPPRPLEMAATFVLTYDLRIAVESENVDIEHIQRLLDEAAVLGVDLSSARLGLAIRRRVESRTARFRVEPSHLAALHQLAEVVQIAQVFPHDVDLWECQNAVFEASRTVYPMMAHRATQGQAPAMRWVEQFIEIAEALKVRITPHE